MEDAVPRPAPASDPAQPPAFDRRRVRRWAVVVSAVLGVAYLLLQNPYWVPGGDSDFYVAIARAMARSPVFWTHPLQDFLYNGLPVAISPPGWPWVMAVILKLSPTFLALKLAAMLSMYGSLVIGYFVALRFLKPSAAAWATVLAGLLMPVYSLTYFLHSEGVYCLLSAIALLLALRIRERRGGAGHTVLLLIVCVSLPLVRWAGIFQVVPIVAVLLSGRWNVPLRQRHWKTALSAFLLIVFTWAGMRHALKLSPEMAKNVSENGVGTTTDVEVDEPGTDSKPVVIGGEINAKHGIVREYFDRVLRAGKWFSWTLWQPTRFVSVIRAADVIVVTVGWGVIALLVFLAVHEARRGEWLWVALVVYTGGLCLNWDNPNSRYFVPVAPLILVGLMLATRRLAAAFPLRPIDPWKWLRRGIVYSVLGCNLAMFGVDVIVMRSPRFYQNFEGGQHKDLIAIARYLMTLAPQPATQPTTRRGSATAASQPFDPYAQVRPENGDIMLNERYENLGRVRFSKAGSRAMVLLTDRYLKTVEYTGKLNKQIAPPFSQGMANKMKQRGTEWLVVQAPAVPWRVWHFHLPADWYKKLAKTDSATTSGGWTVYHFARYDKSFVEQPVPAVENWPTRVPGM